MANSILFLSFIFGLPFIVDSVNFRFTNFRPGDPENVVYHGDAIPDGAVNFNNVEYIARVGWVTYAEKVPFWNPKTGKSTDFNTSFSFRIDTRNLSNYGHGICFFLAPVGIQLPVNSAGGFLGLFTRIEDYKSSFPLVHIEFDSFSNKEWDPSTVGSHVGINNNSLVSSNYTSWNASSHSQDIGHAKISYNSVTKNLSVSWAYELTSDPRESLGISYIIDLAKVLPPDVTVGFSAATGSNIEGHRLLSWEFSSSLDSEKASIRKGLIVGISVSGFVFLFSLVTIVVVLLQKHRKRKAKEIKDLVSLNEDLERDAGPRRFVYKDLVIATNKFSAQRKLGEGGFGAVYRGTFGYMAPEYVMDGRASKESDIYSFGIGILEIVTGKKSVDHSEENIETSLVERVWDLYGRQELMSAIDKKLGEDFDKNQAECLLVVGLWCGHPDRNSRPSIKQAIQVLNLESPLPQLPPKMPSATFHISPSSSLLLSSNRVSVIQVSREQMMRDEEDLGGLCGSET
ncbi:unnamed protein product [Arabidopsis arenosa]|uniref:Protein kinase domain-containing protein n=1 Tax=Arabidopsis arenosa TaxID=38785 RepID=A0A8S2B2Y3_ARAAE|nr:unnamed protein product [Arabidopsis arenosa]